MASPWILIMETQRGGPRFKRLSRGKPALLRPPPRLYNECPSASHERRLEDSPVGFFKILHAHVNISRPKLFVHDRMKAAAG